MTSHRRLGLEATLPEIAQDILVLGDAQDRAGLPCLEIGKGAPGLLGDDARCRRYRVAVRADVRVVEVGFERLKHSRGHGVLEQAGVLVGGLPVKTQDVDEERLGDAVLAHDVECLRCAGLGQADRSALSDDQVSGLETSQRRGDRGARDPHRLRDLRRASRAVLAAQLVDGLEVLLERRRGHVDP